MFICTKCLNVIGPHISPIISVSDVRQRNYENIKVTYDEYERPTESRIESEGYEIVREDKLCTDCAGIEVPTTSSVTMKGGKSFEEAVAPPMRVPLVAFAANSAVERFTHNTKRAQLDIETVVPMIKSFVDNNKEYTF